MAQMVERLVAGAGQGLTWAPAFSPTTIAGLPASDTAIQSDIVIDNSVALDLYADLSLVMTQPLTGAGAGAYCWFFLYPLNQDLVTFGDNRFTTQQSGLPAPYRQYFCGACVFQPGNIPQYGVMNSILLPPAKFKFVIFNPHAPGITVPFPSSGTNVYYRTYNRIVQ